MKPQIHRIDKTLSEMGIAQTKIVKESEIINDNFVKIKQKFDEKANKSSVIRLEDSLKKYAAYKDLKELYNKLMPSM